MTLQEKVYRNFNAEFEGDEREAMVFVAGLARMLIENGGRVLFAAAANAVQRYAAADLPGPDKRTLAAKDVRAALDAADLTDFDPAQAEMGETPQPLSISDTAIDSAVQAALCNHRVMMAAAGDVPNAIPGMGA